MSVHPDVDQPRDGSSRRWLDLAAAQPGAPSAALFTEPDPVGAAATRCLAEVRPCIVYPRAFWTLRIYVVYIRVFFTLPSLRV